MSAHRRIKVGITDDHPLVVKGLQNVLSAYPHLVVSHTYATGEELLAGLRREQPDVLLLDINLPDKTGNELIRVISKKYPGIRVLALTSIDSSFHVKDMMQHGCMGYLLKNADAEMLVQAIERVYAGEEFLEPELKDRLLRSMLKIKKQAEHIRPTLTRREKEILQLIAGEYTSQEIAQKLSLSQRTVDNHRFSLLQKLHAKNSIGLVKSALQLGLIE